MPYEIVGRLVYSDSRMTILDPNKYLRVYNHLLDDNENLQILLGCILKKFIRLTTDCPAEIHPTIKNLTGSYIAAKNKLEGNNFICDNYESRLKMEINLATISPTVEEVESLLAELVELGFAYSVEVSTEGDNEIGYYPTELFLSLDDNFTVEEF